MMTSLVPSVNALSLGSDLAAASSRLLWQPAAELLAATPVPAVRRSGNSSAPETFADLLQGGRVVSGGKSEVFSAGAPSLSMPDDGGSARRDSHEWMKANRRTLEEGLRAKLLITRIRERLWQALTTEPLAPVARLVFREEMVYVRITTDDGSPDRYTLEIFGKQPPDMGHRHALWRLNPKTGELHPIEMLSHAAILRRAQEREPDLRGFVPFYGSLRLASAALKSGPFLPVLAPRLRQELAAEPQPQTGPRGPGLFTRFFGMLDGLKAEEPTQIPDQESVLVRYIHKVRQGSTRDTDFYCDLMNLPEKGALAVRRIVNDLLSELYRLESRNSSLGRDTRLWVWLRSVKGAEYKRLEIGNPEKMLEAPPADDDVLLILVRDPRSHNCDYPYLAHWFLRSESDQGKPRPLDADLTFQTALGLKPDQQFHLRLDHLHVFPPDLAAWSEWMVANRIWRKTSR